MMKIGFSTTNNWVSKIIRKMTHSKVSHAWIYFDNDSFFGFPLVLESTTEGFRIIPYEQFKKANIVVTLVDTKIDISSALVKEAQNLGESYDFIGLIGMFFVMIGKWFKMKIKNPSHNLHSMFCSEAVVRILQQANYPGTKDLDPKNISPEDLYELLNSL